MTGTPLYKLILKTKETTLEHRRDTHYINYLFKLKHNHNLSFANMIKNGYRLDIQQYCWSGHVEAVKNICDKLEIKLNNEALNIFDYNLEVLKNVRFNIDIHKIISPIKDEKVKKALFEQYWENKSDSKHTTYIFCDASKTEGNVGFGIYIPELDLGISSKLDNKLHINTAELLAINRAIDIAIDNNLQVVTIFSDSLMNIKQLKNPFAHMVDKKIRGDIINQTKNKIRRNENNLNLEICWLPTNNELPEFMFAEMLAKSSITGETVDYINLGLSDITPLLEDLGQKTWSSKVQVVDKYKKYLEWVGGEKEGARIILNSRKEEIIVNRLKLEQCNLKYYTHKIGLNTTPLCTSCNVPENIDHILTSCQNFKTLIQKLKYTCNKKKLTYSVQNILNHQDTIDIILDYMYKNNITL